MNRYIRIVTIMALMALLCPELGISQADTSEMTLEELLKLYGISLPRSTWLPLDVFMEPSPLPSEPGEVNIRLMVVAYQACDEVRFKISKIQNLEFLGPDVSSFSVTPHDTVTYDLSVIVPANDTSGLEFDVFCDRVFHKATIWFETTGDSIRWSVDPPWGPYGHPDTWQRRTTPRPERPPQEPEPYKGPTTRRGFEDRDGNFIPRDSLEPGMVIGYYDLDSNWVRVPNPADSLIVRPGRKRGQKPDSTRAWCQDEDDNWHYGAKDSLRQVYQEHQEKIQLEKRLEQMREMEKTPLTEYTHQTFSLGGKMYERRQGEYKFTEVTDRRPPPNRYWKDSVEMASGRTRDYTLDLRQPEHYDKASSEIDSLIPTDSTGIYRAHLTRAQIRMLEKEGIILRRTHDKPGRRAVPRPADDNPAPHGHSIAPQGLMQLPRGVETLLYEGFDSVFPGTTWVTYDSLPSGFAGEDYWGLDTCRMITSPKSLWCSATGDADFCQWYDFDMQAHLDLVVPVSLVRHESIVLSYQIWYDLWVDTVDDGLWNDMVYVWMSQNGTTWEYITAYDESSSGWDNHSHALEIDHWDSLYIRFVFYGGWDSELEEGAYLEDISIRGTKIPWPDLTASVPPGWSGSIVPSDIQNTNIFGDLYVGQETYIDYAVKNIGQVNSGQFYTRILIDSVWIDDFWLFSVESDDFGYVQDYEWTVIDPGSHVLSMQIDIDGDIDEESETNNYYEQTFTWEEPPVYEPNLTYTVPYYWDAPIVASNHEGGHRNTALFANTSTYIDWNVKNTGNAASGYCWTYLLIDGELSHGQGVPGLSIGERFDIDDIWCNLIDSGYHALRIVIDTLAQVTESNELV